MIVLPLASLLRGERAEVIDLLGGVPTESWPSGHAVSASEDENDSETA